MCLSHRSFPGRTRVTASEYREIRSCHPRKAATVLYGVAGAEALLAKLGKHTTGKGCLYIKKLADVDQQVLEALVVKSVAAMRARYPG